MFKLMIDTTRFDLIVAWEAFKMKEYGMVMRRLFAIPKNFYNALTLPKEKIEFCQIQIDCLNKELNEMREA